MQVLFQVDLVRAKPELALERLLAEQPLDEEDSAFAAALLHGVLEHLPELDARIRRHTVEWELERLAGVDRSILRLAVYELARRPDIPPPVTINEAVELAKEYSGEESARFINGLLDQVWQELRREGVRG